MILRDHRGAIIFSSYRTLYRCADALQVELEAIKEGCSLGVQCSTLPILMESGCIEPVHAILNPERDKSRHAGLIEEVKCYL